jgi:hypothetical protein
MLMSSDKHTPLAGFVVNKNVIKPYTPVLLFPAPISTIQLPFSLAASSRFTGPAVGRKLDGEEPEQNVLILSFNPTQDFVFVWLLDVVVDWTGFLLPIQ